METNSSLADSLRMVEVVFTSACEEFSLRSPSEPEAESLIAAAAAATSCLLKVSELIANEFLKEPLANHSEAEGNTVTQALNLEMNSLGQVIHAESTGSTPSPQDFMGFSQSFQQDATYDDANEIENFKDFLDTIKKNESYQLLAEDVKMRGIALFPEKLRSGKVTVAKSENCYKVWIECCEILCGAAFSKRFGAEFTDHLSRIAPDQSAYWLECLKSVGMAIQLARPCRKRLKRSQEELAKERTGAQDVFLQEEALEASLRWMWPELNGPGGLMSKRWRTRLAAAELSAVLYDNDSSKPMDVSDASFVAICRELLHRLVANLALSDPQWLVRRGAIKSASRIFKGVGSLLSVTESDRLIWGFLATSLDKQVEVQKAVVESFLQDQLVAGSQHCKEMVGRLIGKFITIANLSIRSLQKRTKVMRSPEVEGFNDSPDTSLVLAAMNGVIQLRLLSKSPSQKRLDSGGSQSLVPLLVASSAALLEESEASQNRPIFTEVSRLLRSLGLFEYGGVVLSMLSHKDPSYMGASVARWYKALCVIDDETADLLEGLESVIIMKGISVALEGLESQHDLQAAQQEDDPIKNSEIGKLEILSLQYIVEMVDIPSNLVQTTQEFHENNEAQKFLVCSYYFLRIAKSIVKDRLWVQESNANKQDLVKDLVLTCAALASAEDDAGASLSWISRDVQELAVGIVYYTSVINDTLHGFVTQEARGIPVEACNGIERLILQMLPALLLNFKNRLKDNLSTDAEGNFGAPSRSTSLTSAIIAAHQMYWCLKQVKHPHLGPLCTSLIPCVLMALDHYSPHVKRQAMKAFIHLADNLSPSELRWYKDAILDCVTRSIIGCGGELWQLVVKMAVRLVTCMEGTNPRARWYRSILHEMLGELERHQCDANRCKLWLQHSSKLFEAMGLVLVAYFKRLFPILFLWLHTQDDTIRLLVLRTFCTIVTHTWPRMPYHAERLWQELALTYRESWERTSGSDIRSAVIEVCGLLKLCAGPELEAARQKDGGDPTKDSLSFALDHLAGAREP